VTSGTKAGIKKALMKIHSTADRSRDHPMAKVIPSERVLRKNVISTRNHEDWLFDEFLGTEFEENKLSDEESDFSTFEMNDLRGISALDNLLSLVENFPGESRSRLNIHSDDDYASSDSEANNSLATGTGGKALKRLLGLTKANTSKATNSRKRNRSEIKPAQRKMRKSPAAPRNQLPTMDFVATNKRQQKQQQPNDDHSFQSCNSFSTNQVLNSVEPGPNALESLFARGGNIPRHHTSSYSTSENSSVSSDGDKTPAEYGKDALESLLSKIT
jgi:hypothetical protein